MRRARKAKILATLGPSSSDKATIQRLFEAGADVFRINMSHTDHDKLRRLTTIIREVEAECGRPIGILADLQGPKLRIGTFAGREVTLNPGEAFVLDTDPTPGDKTRVELPHPEIFAALEPGHRLLLDDGKVRLRVAECDDKHAATVIEVGTKLSDRKGVSVPDSLIAVDALTPKDRSDLEAALNAEVDWIALSFVQRPEDLAEVKKIGARPRRGDGQDREAAGGRAARPDHRGGRRADGGTRRSRRGDAARARPRHPEADHPRRPPRRQAGGGGDPDARSR